MVRFYGWGFNKSTSGEISDFSKISDFGDFYKFMGGGKILRLGVQKLTLGVKIIVSPPSGEGREGEKGFFRCFWG